MTFVATKIQPVYASLVEALSEPASFRPAIQLRNDRPLKHMGHHAHLNQNEAHR